MEKKLYVGNLPYSVNNEKLKEIFSEYGEVSDAVVIKNRMTGRSKGFGFVTFANGEDADKALAETDGKEVDIDGNARPLKVSEARPMEPKAPRGDRD